MYCGMQAGLGAHVIGEDKLRSRGMMMDDHRAELRAYVLHAAIVPQRQLAVQDQG